MFNPCPSLKLSYDEYHALQHAGLPASARRRRHYHPQALPLTRHYNEFAFLLNRLRRLFGSRPEQS